MLVRQDEQESRLQVLAVSKITVHLSGSGQIPGLGLSALGRCARPGKEDRCRGMQLTSSATSFCSSALARCIRAESAESMTRMIAVVPAKYCFHEERNDVCPPISIRPNLTPL